MDITVDALEYGNLIRKHLFSLEGQRWRLLAILVNKKPISVAYNRPIYAVPHPYSHAEQRCLRKAPQEKLDGATLFVYRIDCHGKVRIAKPCTLCMKLIKTLPLKTVLYSTNDGGLEEISL